MISWQLQKQKFDNFQTTPGGAAMNCIAKLQKHCKELFWCLLMLLFSTHASAMETLGCDPAANAACTTNNDNDNVSWDLYLSGYAHHQRGAYTEKRLKNLNEKAWGGGFGRTVRNARGNDESMYLLSIRDSNKNRQWMGGYAYQWMYPVAAGIEAGAGLTALIIKREDWFDGRPFPAVLPVGSFGYERVKMVVTYVPHVSIKAAKGKGNVFLFIAKLGF
jgi:palmitoyl transferase